jgi:hypothetical protein
VRRLVLTALLACVLAAPAAAFVEHVTLRGDLDGDRGRETVEAVRVDLEGVDDPFDRTAIRVSDSCRGRFVTRRVAGPQDNLATLRLRAADTRPGREILVDLRSGASGRLGEARLVAWRRGGASCRRPRSLFTYLSDRPTSSPPGATGEVSFFSLRLRNASARYGGVEVVLFERFLKRGDPVCCGSIRKTSLFRYSRARDRYVRYRTTIRP